MAYPQPKQRQQPMLVLDHSTGEFVPVQGSFMAPQPQPRGVLALPPPPAKASQPVQPMALPAIEDRQPVAVEPTEAPKELESVPAPAADLTAAKTEAVPKAEPELEADTPKSVPDKKPKLTANKAVERLSEELERRDTKRGTNKNPMKKPASAMKAIKGTMKKPSSGDVKNKKAKCASSSGTPVDSIQREKTANGTDRIPKGLGRPIPCERTRIRLMPSGCTSCRHVKGCTPSCWLKKGWVSV